MGGSGGVCLFPAALNVPLHGLRAGGSDAPAPSRGSSTTSCEAAASHPGPVGRERGGQPRSFPPPPRPTHGARSSSRCGEQGPTGGSRQALGLPPRGWAVQSAPVTQPELPASAQAPHLTVSTSIQPLRLV